MLFWIFMEITIAGLLILIYSDELGENLGVTMFIIGTAVSLIMFFCIVFSHVGTDARVARYESRYDMLVYQYENEVYENDNDLGKRELIVDIQDWNEDLAYYQTIQDDFWLGIFYPNVFDQLKFIELKGE